MLMERLEEYCLVVELQYVELGLFLPVHECRFCSKLFDYGNCNVLLTALAVSLTASVISGSSDGSCGAITGGFGIRYWAMKRTPWWVCFATPARHKKMTTMVLWKEAVAGAFVGHYSCFWPLMKLSTIAAELPCRWDAKRSSIVQEMTRFSSSPRFASRRNCTKSTSNGIFCALFLWALPWTVSPFLLTSGIQR